MFLPSKNSAVVLHNLLTLTLFLLLSPTLVSAVVIPGRWGHTLTYIPSTSTSSSTSNSNSNSPPYILIQGGRSDPPNAYSYTSAPLVGTEDDLTWLSLDQAFETGDVPWVRGSSAAVTPVCWGISAWLGGGGDPELGPGYLISFGGDGGPLLPLQTSNDSLVLSQLVQPSADDAGPLALNPMTTDGSGEPMRRWSSALVRWDEGRVWVVGGIKGDGSGLGFKDCYEVEVGLGGTVRMNQKADLPVDLAGHRGVRVTGGGDSGGGDDDGVLVLGGWSPSTLTLVSMDKGYLFTPSSGDSGLGEWRTVDLSPSSSSTSSSNKVPPARRGFTLTLVSSTKAILFGGIASTSISGGEDDGSIVFDDLWELDLEGFVWKELSGAEDQGQASAAKRGEEDRVGQRFDHDAIAVDGRLLVFGGRTSSGMADSELYIYDVEAGTWTSSFTPISPSARSNVNGFASSDEDGSQVPVSAGSGVPDGQASEVVVTRTAANGDIILSTSTSRVNPTRSAVVVVVTTTSTGVVVTTDSSGLTVTSTIKATLRITSTGRVSPTERPGANDNDEKGSGSNKTAIALGTVFGCFGLIGLAALVWLIRRKRQGKIISTKGFILKPWGGRPDRGARRAYPIMGEGAQSLMEDHVWDGTEKMFTPVKSSRGAMAYSTPTGSSVPGKGFTASANPYSPGHPALLTNFMDRLRNVSGRGAPRFDILADEDRSDVWVAPRNVVQHEKESSGRSTQTDQGQSMESEGFRIHHPAIPSNSTQEASEEGGLATPVAATASQARRRVSGKVLPSTPLRDPFEDPIENYYDAGIIDYADGVSADHSSSSFTSRESARNSVSTAAIQTAVKVDFSNSPATYLPLKRNSSLISRLAGAGASFFNSSRASRASITETDGFLDPTPPPGLDPIAESTSAPSSWNSCNTQPEPYRNQSYTSIETSATATSDMLANYGNMQVIQRERTASSRRQSLSNGEADLGDVFMTRLEETAPPIPSTPPRANSPRPREHITPKGPRTAPPRHPTHIDLTPRRTVRDLADSINRRDFAIETPVLPTPSPLQATPASFVAAPPVMHSPYRGLGGPRGPRRPTTSYEVAARGPLTVANPE